MNCSFQPNGRWFVFNEETGETIVKDFSSKKAAIDYIARSQGRKA